MLGDGFYNCLPHSVNVLLHHAIIQLLQADITETQGKLSVCIGRLVLTETKGRVGLPLVYYSTLFAGYLFENSAGHHTANIRVQQIVFFGFLLILHLFMRRN